MNKIIGPTPGLETRTFSLLTDTPNRPSNSFYLHKSIIVNTSQKFFSTKFFIKNFVYLKIPDYARGARINITGLLNEFVSVLGPDPTVGLQINTGVFTEATLEDQRAHFNVQC